jgi:ABC-2 type transport system permease protein
MVLHADKLRWLFWLRWKVFSRGFTRNAWSVVRTILLFLFVLWIAGLAAVGSFLAYRFLPAPANIEVLFLVLTAVYFLWILLPLLEYTVNEGLDVSKLIQFPLTRAELMASLLFSTLLDIPTIGLFLIFAAVVAGWALSVPVGILAFVAMLIFYAQVIGISQLVLAVLMRTLQSRRFRDLSIIIIAVFSSSCYLIQQFVLGGTRIEHFYESLKSGSFSPYLQWLPPGLAARSVQQAALGNWGASFAALGLLLVVTAVVLYLWEVVLERSLSTPEVGGTARRRHHRQQAVATPVSAQPSATRIWERLISPQVLAITNKDLKYFWRDPQLKAMMFQSIIYVAIFILGPLFNPGSERFGGSTYTLYITPLIVFLFTITLSLNSLGLERQSLTTLFLFPVRPERILWGKNLAVFVLGMAELVVLVALAAFLSHAWSLVLPVLAVALAGMGITLGCGNFTSVYFPQFVRQMQRGFRATGASSQGGCLRAVTSLVMLVVTAILLIPVAVALIVPVLIHAQWIWVFSIPLALAYGITFHQVVTRLVAPRIVERAPEILAITTREQ